MASNVWPDWLPADWTVQINKSDKKKVKCYVDSQGHKCYSKPQVFEYLTKMGRSIPNVINDNGNGSNVDLSLGETEKVPDSNEMPESSPGEQVTKLTRTSRRKSKPTGGSSYVDGSPSEPLSSEKHHGDSSWLPDGWTVEVKTRQSGSSSGMKFKCYTDPISGKKFLSKPQVLNHIAETNRSGNVQKVNPKDNSALDLDKSQTIKSTEVEKNNSEKKTESSRLSSDYEVVSRTPVEGLPPGWIKEMRLRKRGVAKKTDPFYLDPLSELVFFSKKDALRYLESGNVKSCVMKPLIRDMSKDSLIVDMPLTGGETYAPPDPSKETEASKGLPNNPVTGSNTNGSATELNTHGSGIENQKPTRSITGGEFSTPNTSRKEVRSISGGTFPSPCPIEDYPEWLPDGWVVEVHRKASGQKFKVYKETATGKKLFSKPQVLNYLDGGSSISKKRKEYSSSKAPDSSQILTSADGSRPKRSIKKTDNSKKDDEKNDETYDERNDAYEEVITTCPADGLPPGWIKELRTKIYATHKRNDPYYTDPESGYIFRSKLDALRFLEHGDINLCAIRPKMKDKDGNEVTVPGSVVKKPAHATKRKQLFEDEEEEEESSEEKQDNDEDPKTTAISRKGTRVSGRIAKRNDSPTTASARSSKRQKGFNLGSKDNAAAEEKHGAGVNLEKQPDDEGQLSFDIPDDDNWTAQCIDFAVKTLTNEIVFNPEEGAASAANAGVGPTGANEAPAKVN